MRFNRKGSTLTELIIVLVIIGVLASIAVLINNNIKAKAISMEAIGGMTAIRIAVGIYSAQWKGLPPTTLHTYIDQCTPTELAAWYPGLSLEDLDGVYFRRQCYRRVFWDIFCFVHEGPGATMANNAPKSSEARQIADSDDAVFIMDCGTGGVGQQRIPKSGYPPG